MKMGSGLGPDFQPVSTKPRAPVAAQRDDTLYKPGGGATVTGGKWDAYDEHLATMNTVYGQRKSYASLLGRLLANILDAGFLAVFAYLYVQFTIMSMSNIEKAAFDGMITTHQYVQIWSSFPRIFTGVFLMIPFYEIVLTALFGGTFGKLILSQRIVTDDGKAVGVMGAALRCLFKAMSVLTVGGGFVVAVFSAKNRTLHDMLAGTVVVVVD